jgi:cytochrome c oxidase accessory protein FixG
MKVQELPEDRLATMNEEGKRVYLFPADVEGKYHRRRRVVHALLVALFLLLPWIRINGYQSILLDIAHRRFVIFGLAFWAHDAPMLVFVFGAVLIGISLLTAVKGRLWCGWGCPETVFVEFVYRQIERWIEGNAVQRKRLADAPISLKKLAIKGFKWSVFLAITLIITHSFLAYFIGVETLGHWIRRPPAEHPTAFSVMAFTTAVLLFSFGWFREQFCIIMCPYGRFQSVLMDENSLAVIYDEKRGEPRRGPDVPKAEQGDCISCYRCVQVCPTGVDIRRGVQMECVACTACIDACDEVMLHQHKEPGLISYTTLNELDGKKTKNIRTRVVLLSTALVAIVSAMSFVLITRDPVKTTVFNAKNVPFIVLDKNKQDSMIANQFFLVSSNYTFEDADIQLKVLDPDLSDKVKLIIPTGELSVRAGKEIKNPFLVEFHKELLKQGRARLTLQLTKKAQDGKWVRVVTQEIPLAGPY